jgi:hypothetical protein
MKEPLKKCNGKLRSTRRFRSHVIEMNLLRDQRNLCLRGIGGYGSNNHQRV